MFRKLTKVGVGVLAAAAAFVPMPQAHAATGDAAVVVFTAGANITGGQIFTPVESPLITAANSCGNAANSPDGRILGVPFTCNGAASRNWSFSTANNGLGGQRACGATGRSGVTVSAGVTTSVGSAGVCVFVADGTLGRALGQSAAGVNVGGWCGLSSGNGRVTTATFGGAGTTPVINALDAFPNGLSVQWVVSAATVLPLVFTTVEAGLTVPAGVGAVQTTGAQPGTCGLAGSGVPGSATEPRGTESFAVTGFAAVVDLI